MSGDRYNITDKKLKNIHANPVAAEIVTEESDNKFSSAKYSANEPTKL